MELNRKADSMSEIDRLWYNEVDTELQHIGMLCTSGSIIIQNDLVSSHAIAYDPSGELVYWIDDRTTASGTVEVNRLDRHGDNKEKIYECSGTMHPWGLAVSSESGTVFFTDMEEHNLYSMGIEIPSGETPSTRTDVTKIASGLHEPVALDIDVAESKLYVLGRGVSGQYNAELIRCNFDGSGPEILLSGDRTSSGDLRHPYDFVLTNEQIYWTDLEGHYIKKSDLDGSNVETIISSGLHYPFGITASFFDTVYEIPENVMENFAYFGGEVIGDRLFFIDDSQSVTLGKIKSCTFEGTDCITLCSGLRWPGSISVIPTPLSATSGV